MFIVCFWKKKKIEQWDITVTLVKQIFNTEGITAMFIFSRKTTSKLFVGLRKKDICKRVKPGNVG